MQQRFRQSGEGRLGCMIWVALFLIAAMVAFKMVPVRIQAGQLQDFMSEQAKFGARAGNEKVARLIVARAKELGLPVERKNVKIEIRPKRVKMDVHYVVPIEFPGYTYYWKFHARIDEVRFRV